MRSPWSRRDLIRAPALCAGLAACSPTTPTVEPQRGNEAGAAAQTATATATAATTTGKDVDMGRLPWARLRGVKPIEITPDTARWERLGVKTAHAFLGKSPDVILVVYGFADPQALLAARDELLAIAPSRDALQVSQPPGFYRKAASTGGWLLIAGLPAEKPPSPEMEAARDAYLRVWSGDQ